MQVGFAAVTAIWSFLEPKLEHNYNKLNHGALATSLQTRKTGC